MKRLIIIQMLIGLLFCSNAMAQSDTTEIEVLNADEITLNYDSGGNNLQVRIIVELDLELFPNDSVRAIILNDQSDTCYDYKGRVENDGLGVAHSGMKCAGSVGEGELRRSNNRTFFWYSGFFDDTEDVVVKVELQKGTQLYELTLFNQLNHLYFAPPTNWNETWLYFNETWPSQETAEWPGIQLGTAKTSWIDYSFPEPIHGSSFVLHNGSGTQTQEMLVVGDTWVHIPDEYDVDSLGNVKVALYHEEPDLGTGGPTPNSVTRTSKHVYATHSAAIRWWDSYVNGDYQGEQFSSDELFTEVCSDSPTDTVFFTDFEFDLPENTIITGAKFSMYQFVNNSNRVKDTLVSLWNDGVIGINLANSEPWAGDTVIMEYGGEQHLWSVNLTQEMVNSPDFGVAFQAKAVYYCTGPYIGDIELTLYYDSAPIPCDSTSYNTINVALCDSIYTVPSGDETYSFIGTQTVYDTLPKSCGGADSIITINLSLQQSAEHVDTIEACDSYTWIDGNTYTANNNTATTTLTTAQGCDSLVSLDLKINYSTEIVDVQESCGGYVWMDGNTYFNSTNSPVYIIPNETGCDSIFYLDLTILSVDNSLTTTTNTITSQAEDATFRWLNCDDWSYIVGETSASFTPEITGDYAAEVTQNGCTSNTSCRSVIGLPRVEVYFLRPDNNTATPMIHYWGTSPDVGSIAWPGELMVDASEEKGENWFKYEIAGADVSNMLFHSNGGTNAYKTDDLTEITGGCYDGNQMDWVVCYMPPTVHFSSDAPSNECPWEVTVTATDPDSDSENLTLYYTVNGFPPSQSADQIANGGSIMLESYDFLQVYALDETGNSSPVTTTSCTEPGAALEVFFRRPVGNPETPMIHYWGTSPDVGSSTWPGEPMEDASAVRGADWFGYTIEGATTSNMLFHVNEGGVGGYKTDDLTGISGGCYDFNTAQWEECEIITGNVAPSTALMSLYPNPAKSEVTVVYGNQQPWTIQVFDVTGKCVHQQSVNAGVSRMSLDVSGYHPGLYQVVVIAGEQQSFRKIQIVR